MYLAFVEVLSTVGWLIDWLNRSSDRSIEGTEISREAAEKVIKVHLLRRKIYRGLESGCR